MGSERDRATGCRRRDPPPEEEEEEEEGLFRADAVN